jgi:predicted MFS family arabinose efflux permease
MISLVDIAYRGVMPIFFSTPVSLGGLGFSPAAIGACLSVYGICNGIFAVTCFARIHRRFGGKRVLTFSLMLGFPIFALFPIMSIWTKHYGYVTPAVWAMILLQTVVSILYGMSYCKFLPVKQTETSLTSISLCLHLHCGGIA